jgi:hypothetical protein
VVAAYTDSKNLSGTGDFTVTGPDGVQLTVSYDAAGFTPGPTSPTTDAFIAGVQVDPATAGLPIAGIEYGSVAGMWYFGNPEAEIDPGWSFTVNDPLGLPEGTVLNVWVADYTHIEWKSGGTATVTGGQIVSEGGLTILSTLILTTAAE